MKAYGDNGVWCCRLCGTREVASSAGAQQEEQQQQGLAYIRISTFSKATAEGVRAAIQQLQAQGASRCRPQVGLVPILPSLLQWEKQAHKHRC